MILCIELILDDSPPTLADQEVEFIHDIFKKTGTHKGKLPLRLLFLVTWICGIFEVAEMSSMALTKRIFRMQVGGGTWGNVHSFRGGEADLEGRVSD